VSVIEVAIDFSKLYKIIKKQKISYKSTAIKHCHSMRIFLANVEKCIYCPIVITMPMNCLFMP